MSEKNLDQSQKSKNGNDFNLETENEFKILINEISIFHFLKKEPEFIKHNSKNGYRTTRRCKLDHLAILVIEKQKKVIVYGIDCTTTYRDRIYGKHSNAIRFHRLKEQVEEMVLSYHPELDEYQFLVNCCTIFPDTIRRKYKNPKNEEEKINKCCRDINYGINDLASEEGYYGLDGSYRLKQFINCVKALAKDVEKGKELNMWSTREKWIDLNNTYDCIPSLDLEDKKVFENIDFTKYCLKNRKSDYSKNDIIRALDFHGIKHSKIISKAKAIALFIEFLDNKK